MKKAHEVWLEAHPERTAIWLQERLDDGFDVHHLDGDRENNDPGNLVLIECRDHQMLHHERRFMLGVRGKQQPKKTDLERGRLAHDWREQDKSWREIAHLLNCGIIRAKTLRTLYLNNS